MKKNNFKGFTLIELLLVIVIIGILAGAVYTMIGNSDNANTKSVLSTAKSIMPYAQECYFKGEDLISPVHDVDGGGPICNGSETIWPGLGPDGCLYAVTANAWTLTCAFNETVIIECGVNSGVCDVN